MAGARQADEAAPSPPYTGPMGPWADVILANRAYCDHETAPGSPTVADGGQGGLLAALRPVVAPWDGSHGTLWVGASRGSHDREWTDHDGFELIPTPRGPLRHRRLFFDGATWRGHYADVANSFLWPLLHLVREPLPALVSYYPAPGPPSDDGWEAYRSVNRAFATAALKQPGAATCWVHDYQLALVPGMLRAAGYGGRIGFFLHTPFPDAGLVERYAAGEAATRFREFVAGILAADLVGVQTEADAHRLQRAASGWGIAAGGRVVAAPVGIDCDELVGTARTAAMPAIAREASGGQSPLVVGMERADFTKGIPERLAAIAAALDDGVRFNYVGVAAPTRLGVPGYERLEEALAAAGERAAASAARAGTRFRYIRGALTWPEVVALQRGADVVFTSSLADGMNLVALQAVIAQSAWPAQRRGTIIVGRDAGVAATLAGFGAEGVVAVDPLDPAAMVEALTRAVTAKAGGISDRLVAEVRRRDAQKWATAFVSALVEGAC